MWNVIGLYFVILFLKGFFIAGRVFASHESGYPRPDLTLSRAPQIMPDKP